jgi:hypothetical protein
MKKMENINNQKSKGEKVMKATNNVRKANFKSTVAAGLLLAGMISSAPLISNATGTHSAMKNKATEAVMSTKTKEMHHLSLLNDYLTEGNENILELEAWMINENNFFASIDMEAETEEALEIENWMVNESNFFSVIDLEAETESVLEIESWMVSGSLWEAAEYLDYEAEEILEVESWMLSDSLFEVAAAEMPTVKNKKSKPQSKSYGTITEGKKFGTRTFIIIEEEDPKLKIKNWMLDNRYWNRK